MVIALISYLHGFGGAEKQIVLLANAMAERGHEVTLISVCANNNCYTLDGRVNYIFLPDRKKNGFRLVTRFIDIKKTLKELHPDITVNFWFQSTYMTVVMKKSITGKIVYSERGDPGDKEYSGILGLIRRMVFPRVDGFVFQTKGARDYFNNRIGSRSVVIPNPVFLNCEDYPEVKNRRKAIVTVGRLHPQKNHHLLIDAFKIVEKAFPDYSLEIYGEGLLEDELKLQIKQLNLDDKVFLKGTSNNIHELIFDASLFVLSSDYEGMPNTLLEAMALKIPCVSTDCRPGGARDIIEDGKSGLIVPVGDSDKLAASIIYLLDRSEEANAMAQCAFNNMWRYMPELIYKEWNNYFETLLE